MMGVVEDVAALRKQIESIQAQKAKHEAAVDAAEQQVATAEARLSEEFGVTTVEQAQTLLAQMQQEIAQGVTALHEKLGVE